MLPIFPALRSRVRLDLKPLPLVLAMAVAWPAAAQQVADAKTPALGEIVVSGSRSEQNKDDLPASIDVIDSKQIEERQIQDIRDAVKDVPNVSVRRAPARFGMASGDTGRDGNSGFNIRGLDGNRVLMLVDGIRQPRSYVFSANAFGRDYFDIGLVERIEILKGPASALYGSDGMAGLVNFITREPSSYLRDGKRFGGSASLGYSGDDNGFRAGVTLAGQSSDSLQWLLSANVGRSHAVENMGHNYAVNIDRTAPNPEVDNSNSLLGKIVLTPNANQKHTLSFEHVEKKSDYTLWSGVAKRPYAATSVTDLKAHNDLERNRLSWDGRFRIDTLLADTLQGFASYQKARSREYAFEDRFTAVDRARDTTYDENMLQLGLQAGKTIRMDGGWAQKIIYGVDFSNADIKNLQTGLTPPAGETFPLKRFPDTRERTSAFYVQDEFVHEQWNITPGVRFDRFSLDADPAGFNATAVSVSGSAVSPKLGVLFRPTSQWGVYGNYGAGFKAPNAFQVNNFFENVTSGYKTIPNPDLKPEKSQNFELGVRGRWTNFNFDATAFTGDYKDFIEENRQVGGRGIPRIDPIIFQSVNIARVRIDGFEVKGEARFPLSPGHVVSVPFAYGQARGRDRTANQPLNSVDPRKLTMGLKYEAPSWNVRLDAAYHAAKNLSDIDRRSLAGAYYAIPAAATLDLGGQWRINRDLRLNLAVVNLTNKKYWQWSDVRGGAVTANNIDAFTQPGRHVNVSLVADF